MNDGMESLLSVSSVYISLMNQRISSPM